METINESNPDKKLRQRQLRAGNVILNYYQPSVKTGKKERKLAPKVLRSRGRPKKSHDLKVKTISFKAPRSLIHFLEQVRLPHRKAKGKGGKIRYMIIKYLIYREREQEQLMVIKRTLTRMRDDLKKYMAIYKRSDNPVQTQKLFINLEKSIQQTRIVMDFYKIPFKDLIRLLPKYQRDLHFAIDWQKQKVVGHA